jgi:hypothetical protein
VIVWTNAVAKMVEAAATVVADMIRGSDDLRTHRQFETFDAPW